MENPMPLALPRYDRQTTYDWNYDHAPDPVEVDVPPVPGTWTFCGLPVASPLGVPAGPLLNGRWCLYYARLGFDVVTYKTVRSRERACFPWPNLQPVECGDLRGGEQPLRASDAEPGSWAVSFGMPSKDPRVWRADVEATRRQLGPGQRLSVSVVGTVQDGWTIDDLAADYARCAAWAAEAGADCVEANFSCPNVATCDGQLYQHAVDAGRVAAGLRAALPHTPLVIKIGHVRSEEAAEELLDALAPHISALAMTNSVQARVVDANGELLFGGLPRGICGAATRVASTDEVRLFARLVRRRGDRLTLIGVGGAGSAAHVRDYLAAGAEAVHLATAAMIDPAIALTIRRELALPRD